MSEKTETFDNDETFHSHRLNRHFTEDELQFSRVVENLTVSKYAGMTIPLIAVHFSSSESLSHLFKHFLAYETYHLPGGKTKKLKVIKFLNICYCLQAFLEISSI